MNAPRDAERVLAAVEALLDESIAAHDRWAKHYAEKQCPWWHRLMPWDCPTVQGAFLFESITESLLSIRRTARGGRDGGQE